MLAMPMSSPKMTRMFGFAPDARTQLGLAPDGRRGRREE